MKRLSVLLVSGALVVLAACSSHTTELNGTLSANTKKAGDFSALATSTTQKHRRPTTTRPRHPRRTTTTSHTSTLPTPPPPPTPPSTISRSGVAGAVVTETCTADRPCQMQPGQQATVALLDSKGNVITSTHTRDNGSFILPAAPGTYTLAANPGSKRQVCDSQQVTVTEGHYTSALIRCHAK